MKGFFAGVITLLSFTTFADVELSRSDYGEKLKGFWLGQCIANWTGIVTEMDKIGGEGAKGEFYTRDDWGTPDQPNVFSQTPSPVSDRIGWVLVRSDEVWGADDDTDIEYLYQYAISQSDDLVLSGEQIRAAWMAHIYTDENSPHTSGNGMKENYLWVSNQRAFDLMQEGFVPPATSAPENNTMFEMIDAQLTTEIFGLFAPARPDFALELAHLPIRTTAQGEAALAAEFYVLMHSLASSVDENLSRKEQIHWLAAQARRHLPEGSYTAAMYDFVESRYEAGVPWETARDDVYVRYQVELADGYDMSEMFCGGCVAAGINFAASIVSLLYGEGDYEQTVKIAALAGWDSDNPAATWGGLLGFMYGFESIAGIFGGDVSERFNIHRTRYGFPLEDGIDNFDAMAEVGLRIVDRFVTDVGGSLDGSGVWTIPSN